MDQLEKHGYFINSDGVKSTEILKKGILQILKNEHKILPEKPKSAFDKFLKESVPKVVTRK